MELSELENEISNLPQEQRKSILKIIDIKITNDMKEVIQKIVSLGHSTNSHIVTAYWVIGIVGGVLTLLLTAIGILISLK